MDKYGNIIMGVDLGVVQTKACAGQWKMKFDSLVKVRSEVVTEGLNDAEGFLIGFEGQTYNVGAKGSYDFKAGRTARETDMAKLLTVFGSYAGRSSSNMIDLLVSGLPVYEFNNYRETLKKTLEGDFRYTFDNRNISTIVCEALIIPQSAGAFFDFIIDDEGNLKDEPLATEDVLVLDIGGRTTDGCIMESSKYSQESFTIFGGVWKAHNELRRLIMKEHRYNLKPYEVDMVMRSNVLTLGGSAIPVEDLVKKATATVYVEMRDELTLYVEDFRKYAALLLTGGGAHVYGELLKEDVTCPIIVTEGAEYANANGYYKYGQFKVKAGQ